MRTKVMIIHTIAWSHYAAKVFSELYQLLNNDNIDLLVVHLSETSRQRSKIGDFDESVHNYPYKIIHKGFLEESNLIRRCTKVIKELLRYKPDILITAGYSDISLIFAAVINKILGNKNIITSDTTLYDRPRKKIKEFIKKMILKYYDLAFCIGSEQRKYLQTLNFPENKIMLAGWYAIDSSFLSSVYRSFRLKRVNLLAEYGFCIKNFIFVGRLSPEKNVITALKAFNNIKKYQNAKDWGLIIVGDGPQRNELEEMIRDLSLGDVFLIGGKNWKEVPKYYALADVFILPSISEPWGLVVNEAMVCGLPVIVSKRAGAYFDLVKDGINGFGFNPCDQRELEEIMLKFINEEVDIEKMGNASIEIIKDYTPENAARKMLKGIKYFLLKEDLK